MTKKTNKTPQGWKYYTQLFAEQKKHIIRNPSRTPCPIGTLIRKYITSQVHCGYFTSSDATTKIKSNEEVFSILQEYHKDIPINMLCAIAVHDSMVDHDSMDNGLNHLTFFDLWKWQEPAPDEKNPNIHYHIDKECFYRKVEEQERRRASEKAKREWEEEISHREEYLKIIIG